MADYPSFGGKRHAGLSRFGESGVYSAPSLTGILTRLEKAGLVVRLKPSNDQRRVFLKLTAEGEKLYEEIGEEVDERYDAIEEVLGREKMLLLKDLLAELAKIEDALNS